MHIVNNFLPHSFLLNLFVTTNYVMKWNIQFKWSILLHIKRKENALEQKKYTIKYYAQNATLLLPTNCLNAILSLIYIVFKFDIQNIKYKDNTWRGTTKTIYKIINKTNIYTYLHKHLKQKIVTK